jgi:hypothetical protein
MHRIMQAEQGRVELSNVEEATIVEHLRKHWEWIRTLDPEGTQSLATDFLILTGKDPGERELLMQFVAVMPGGAA